MPGSRGAQGRWGLLCNAFFVFAKQKFSQHRYFFWINTGFVIPKEEFGKDKLYGGIELSSECGMWIQKICFFIQVEERICDWLWGHAVDTWIRKCTKYGLPSDSVPGVLRTCPCPEDRSEIFPTKVQKNCIFKIQICHTKNKTNNNAQFNCSNRNP